VIRFSWTTFFCGQDIYGNGRTEEVDQIYITLAKNSSDIPRAISTQIKKVGYNYEIQYIAPKYPGFYEMYINFLGTG
jgi:hypothetical protein